MNEDIDGAPPSALGRTAEILTFLMKYRSAGVFGGLDTDATAMANVTDDNEPGKPEEFVADLEKLGPTFVKIGQALSTRPDMVPPEYLKALERIQDDATALDYEVIAEVVESELGIKINTAFSEFDKTPIGAASLAQVHKARLRDGRPVAVKVQRPNITEQIKADLDALDSLANKADRWTDMGRRIKFADWVHEFRRTLLAELDYRTEAENLQRFGKHFDKFDELFVPQPVWDFTKQKVLTMDLVDGVKATDISGMRRAEEDLGALGEAIMRGYLDQVFVHGEIHADPHPGNVLITNDGRVALLDLGMVAHVPPKRRDQLLKLLFAAVDGRGEEVAAEAVAMGTRLEDFDEEKYYREVGQMVSRYSASAGHGRTLSEGRMVLDLTLIGTACGLRTPPELSLLGKTLLNLEGVSTALDPNMDVKKVVESHLESVMRDRLKKSFSPANIASEAIEIQALMRESPAKISTILSLLAENKLQLKMVGLEESHLMENIQKVANRISTGLIVAALIVASAMLMNNQGGPRLMGYPALALVFFVIAAVLGVGIVVAAMLSDRRAKPRETSGPRN